MIFLPIFRYNSVTRNYFENLVRALENGLSDVDCYGACSRTTSSKSIGATSKGRGGRGKGGTTTTSRTSSSNRTTPDDSTRWYCENCAFSNGRNANTCQMCHQRRA